MANYDKPRLGELRPTQIMFTYGVGALVDLPHLSVIVMGLDDWPADPGVAREIQEDRLLRAIRWQLGNRVQTLLAPPTLPDSSRMPDPFGEAARVGVPVATFPRWMHCPRCQLLAPLGSGLFELKSDPYHPDRTRYVHTNCAKAKKPPPVVPARFLVACADGHLDDFPWVTFVHRGPTACASVLRLIEYGPSGEARDLEVRCDTCGASRRMSEAFGEAGKLSMPLCRGRRPHLRDYEDGGCEHQVQTVLLGASNLWFPEVLTTLAIPTASARLEQLVEEHWVTLKHLQDAQNVQLLRSIGQLTPFMGYSDDEVWEAIQRHRTALESEDDAIPDDLKTPEWALFTHPEAHANSNDLTLREVAIPAGFEDLLERVVLVERLREVRAMIGFTRLDAPGEYGEDPRLAQRRAPIARTAPAWVPAAEVRGEGIFIQFREAAIRDWLAQGGVRRRDDEFHASHTTWRKARFIDDPEARYPGLRYVLIHSLSHALMRQFALEAGYTAASVRERIYARNPNEDPDRPDPMAGFLIYTAAPDSEGTLGGLVRLGETDELGRHLTRSLHDAGLCASDPLCAEHAPSRDGITLHGAACHACMFAPETSCEQGNRYLDRSLLVPTVEQAGLAFFAQLI